MSDTLVDIKEAVADLLRNCGCSCGGWTCPRCLSAVQDVRLCLNESSTVQAAHDQEVAKAAAKNALLKEVERLRDLPPISRHAACDLEIAEYLHVRAQSYEGQKAKEAQP